MEISGGGGAPATADYAPHHPKISPLGADAGVAARRKNSCFGQSVPGALPVCSRATGEESGEQPSDRHSKHLVTITKRCDCALAL
jgi:hypothetical protein